MVDQPNKPASSPPAEDQLAPSQELRLEALIGEKLRSYYDDLLAAPVPDRMLDLINALEAKERGQRRDEK